MSKRGYKLQEFVAHTANVNCLCIGKKACRLLITGGDDHRVNLWAIGKPSTLMSLCGHASPIESVAFDSAEVLVLAGASSGVTKLWDLEEAKMIRTLTGHRGNCTAVEFHPFGEFFASGSLDTNLRIWDIRKKGCIHTYKGHTGGINTIKFSPDGRWVVSGGFDNVVKVWDLTAGKLLHDFKFHEGHIRSIGFHPLEFLLATGSADRTVKYWDLETFELIGSSIPEATGVRSLLFHPDGKTLFCGLDDSLKVYSWEPIICHDTIDMGWSTLGDLSINEGKLLSCSYYQNAVGVWAADISLLHPYRAEENAFTEFKFNLQGAHAGNTTKSFSDLHPVPDYETREIKNIYIDTASAIPTASRGAGPQHSPTEAIPLVSKDIRDRPAQKSNSTLGMHAKTDVEFGKSFTAPSTIPRRSPERKCTTSHRRESVASARNNSCIPTKPAHARRPSNSRLDIRSLVVADELGTVDDTKDGLEALDSQLDKNLKFNSRLVREDEARDSSGQLSNIRSVGEKFDRTLSPLTPYDQEKCDKSLNLKKVTSSVKFVNGVAVVPGRTRSLVDKFERRETCEDQKADVAPTMLPETDKTVLMMKAQPPPSGLETKLESAHDDKLPEDLMQNHDVFLSSLKSRLTKIQVVQHFWGKNDIKGAIDALRKLPDHSVQADVVIVLMEKMEILTLDLFSCLLPVLRGLLESKIERHVIISLELLLKFVAVFGGTVCSTISAPPAIGVDLHAEQRRENCSQCFLHLQEIQKLLPTLVRRGGSLARAAQELNLVLQQ